MRLMWPKNSVFLGVCPLRTIEMFCFGLVESD